MGMYGRDGQLDAMVLVMILAKRAGKKGGLGDRDRNNIYIYIYEGFHKYGNPKMDCL
jgi:hypothetical protein